MNTQELKQYIDRVLGNNIRCLLPSYWWKKLFHSVADRIDDVEQSTSKLIDSKVEEVKMPIVESVDEMENLKLAKGRVAAVEKVGESETVKISNCYVSLNREEDWDKYTIVKGVEEKDVILDKDVTAYVIFSASKETMIKDALQVIVESGRFYYMKWIDDEPSVSSLDEVNKALYSGKYRAIFYSNAPDDYFTFYLAKPQPSLYIKGDSWEMLTKENVVNSEDELDRLIVPYGSIAKVNSKKYGKINPFNCYRIISTSQPSSDAVKRNWDKLKRITQIDVTNPDTEPSSMPIMYLHGYANFNGDLIQIGYYNGYKIATSNGSTTVASFDDLNSLLKNSDYRLLAISDTDEHREFFDKYVSLYSPDFIVPNAYIKGDSWERLAKESDITGGGGDTSGDGLIFGKERYAYVSKHKDVNGNITELGLSEEQRTYNQETYEMLESGSKVYLSYEGTFWMQVGYAGSHFYFSTASMVLPYDNKVFGRMIELSSDGEIALIDTLVGDSSEEVQNLRNEIIANEKVHAAALNDLNDRINNISGESSIEGDVVPFYAVVDSGELSEDYKSKNVSAFNSYKFGQPITIIGIAGNAEVSTLFPMSVARQENADGLSGLSFIACSFPMTTASGANAAMLFYEDGSVMVQL